MTFEVYKTRGGRFRLRQRDEQGQIVKVSPGRIHLPPDPEADQRSRAALQEVLRQRYETQQAAKA